MPHILKLLIWYVDKNASYFNVAYFVCQEECLICELDLFGVRKRMPHISRLLIWCAEKNSSYFNVTYLVYREGSIIF